MNPLYAETLAQKEEDEEQALNKQLAIGECPGTVEVLKEHFTG